MLNHVSSFSKVILGLSNVNTINFFKWHGRLSRFQGQHVSLPSPFLTQDSFMFLSPQPLFSSGHSPCLWTHANFTQPSQAESTHSYVASSELAKPSAPATNVVPAIRDAQEICTYSVRVFINSDLTPMAAFYSPLWSLLIKHTHTHTQKKIIWISFLFLTVYFSRGFT